MNLPYYDEEIMLVVTLRGLKPELPGSTLGLFISGDILTNLPYKDEAIMVVIIMGDVNTHLTVSHNHKWH